MRTATYDSNISATPGLRRRAINASGWVVLGYGVSQVIRLGSNLIMTRLLAPEMFGVMAIANMLLTAVTMFSDLGIHKSVVQSSRAHEAAYLNTAWTLQAIRSTVMAGLVLGIAALIHVAALTGIAPTDSVYANRDLSVVIAVLSFATLIAGLESNKIWQASRRLTLKGVTAMDLTSQAVGLCCMLAWASWDRSIWALVAGAMASSIARTTLSHWVLPGISNRLAWDRSTLQDLVGFGKWLFLSSILGFLLNNGDRLVLGALLSAEDLGVYAIAFLLVSAIDMALSKLIADVSFPALAEVARERPQNLPQVFYRFHFLVGCFALFLAGLLSVFGGQVVHLLYDRRYAAAGPMMEILAVGLVMMPYRLSTECFLSLGIPRVVTFVLAARLLALYLAIPVGYQLLGVPGALWALVLSPAISLPIVWREQRKAGFLDIKRELAILPALAAGFAGGQLLLGAVRMTSAWLGHGQ